jgi:hypothetical protein
MIALPYREKAVSLDGASVYERHGQTATIRVRRFSKRHSGKDAGSKAGAPGSTGD